MGKNNVLYDRNHVGYAKDIGAKKLYIDGSLYPAIIRADYEGRLQIHNAVGACQAEIVQVTAGVLPGNYSIYADNATSEVVLTWPGTKTISNALLNPGLETGDLTGWTVTPVGGSASLEVNSTHPHSGSKSAYWAGGKGLGSEGGIECYVENNTKGIVTPGQKVSASVWILYNPDGGTPKGSRGQCRLNWYDSNDNKISTSPGYLVKTRKFNGKWTNTIVSDKAPLGTAYARLVSWITATGEGHTYFDDAGWDIPDATGATVDGDITLKIKVTDSIGRIAYWEGTVVVFNGYATLDPASLHPLGGSISSGNLKYLGGGGAEALGYTVLSNGSRSFGKIYWEVTAINGAATEARVRWGVDNHTPQYTSTTAYIAGQQLNFNSAAIAADGKAYTNSASTSIGLSTIFTNDIVRLRVDLDAGILETAINGGSWKVVTNKLPKNQITRACVSVYYGIYYPEGGIFNFGATPFAYAVPPGYEPGWLS